MPHLSNVNCKDDEIDHWIVEIMTD